MDFGPILRFWPRRKNGRFSVPTLRIGAIVSQGHFFGAPDTPCYKKSILGSKWTISGINFFFRFLLRLSENNHSRVMFMAKFGKSSEFNPKNGEQVKSSPASNVWSHEGSNLDPKNHQNFKTKIGGQISQ